MTQHSDLKQLSRGQVDLANTSGSQSITEGSRPRIQVGTEAEAIEECCSLPHSVAHAQLSYTAQALVPREWHHSQWAEPSYIYHHPNNQ